MLSHMRRMHACVRFIIVLGCCAGCDAFEAESADDVADRTRAKPSKASVGHDDHPIDRPGRSAPPPSSNTPGMQARLRHHAVQSYDAVDLWRNARTRCSATEGRWRPGLASCGCPPRTVFTHAQGCVDAPPLRPRDPRCTGSWAHLPTACLKELNADALAVRLNWGTAKRPRTAFAAHAESDWTRWFAGALALPEAPTTLHLVGGKRFAVPVLAWLGFDATEPLPMAAPFSARAALHEGEERDITGPCVNALERAQASANVIVPLCEGIATTLAAVRHPDRPQAAVLRAITVSVNDQAGIAQVVGTYAWQGIFSTVQLPWMHGVVPVRRIASRHVDGQRITAFVSGAGTVHAWAVDGAQPVQMLFDDAGKLVHEGRQ